MGGVDKGWVDYQGKPLIEHVIHRLQPHVDDIIISANREIARYQSLGYPVYPDLTPDYAGPLSGLASCLPHLKAPLFQLAPCDTPTLPHNLTEQLRQRLGNRMAAIPQDAHSAQPLCGLYRATVQTSLDEAVKHEQRRVMAWMQSLSHALVKDIDWAGNFDNINTKPLS